MDDRRIYRDTTLMLCDEVKIRRHKKVKMDANPFDPTWDHYVAKRDLARFLEKSQEKLQKAGLLKRQMGLCTHREQSLTVETGYHVHHVIPRSNGGTDKGANLELIHPGLSRCHHVHHPSPRSVASRPHATLAAYKSLSCIRGNSYLQFSGGWKDRKIFPTTRRCHGQRDDLSRMFWPFPTAPCSYYRCSRCRMCLLAGMP